MPDPIHVKLNHQFVDNRYVPVSKKSALYSHQFLTYLSLKILQSDWLRAFLHLTREPDFSQTCSFNRIIKVIMEHDLNPKNLHINGLFSGKTLGVFLDISPKLDFFLKNLAVSFLPLRHPNFREVSEKYHEPLWRKCVYLLTYRPTDSGETLFA